MHVIKIVMIFLFSLKLFADDNTMRYLYDKNPDRYYQHINVDNLTRIDVDSIKEKERVLKNKTVSFGIGFVQERYEAEEGFFLEKISPSLFLNKDINTKYMKFSINGSLSINNLLIYEMANLKILKTTYFDIGIVGLFDQKVSIASQKNSGFLSYQYGINFSERLFSLSFDQYILISGDHVNVKLLFSKENIGLYFNHEIIDPLNKEYDRDQYEYTSAGLFFKF